MRQCEGSTGNTVHQVIAKDRFIPIGPTSTTITTSLSGHGLQAISEINPSIGTPALSESPHRHPCPSPLLRMCRTRRPRPRSILHARIVILADTVDLRAPCMG